MTDTDWLKNIISPNEKIIKVFGYSEKIIKLFLIVFIFLGIIFLPVVGVGLFFLLIALIGNFYFKKAFNYVITNKRIIASLGWLSKKHVFIEYKMITDTEIRQDFFQRLMNVGDLLINTAGSSKKELILKGIDNPIEIKKAIDTNL